MQKFKKDLRNKKKNQINREFHWFWPDLAKAGLVRAPVSAHRKKHLFSIVYKGPVFADFYETKIKMTTDEAKQKHINWGHLAIIAVVAGVLVFITFLKDGFHLAVRAKTADAPKEYTYAAALREAEAEVRASKNPDGAQPLDQLAMLDPNITAGSVLGLSTGTEDSIFPDASELVNQEQLDQITLLLIPETNAELIYQYKADVAAVESEYDSQEILSALSGSDQNELSKVSGRVETLISALLGVSVPKDLEAYHKYKILHYAELAVLADGYAGVAGAADPKDTGMGVFSLSAKLQQLASDIASKYGVQL